jgi:ABC-type Zn uptake system ZnuABC Zn-binding protein ZnuA
MAAMRTLLAVAAALVVAAAGCGGEVPRDSRTLVVTTVSPLTDVVRQVAGTAADVEGLVPEGVDSHTFEPAASSARLLARADAVFLNGLGLEEPTRALAEANVRDGTPIVALGDEALDESAWVYDFSFPEEGGLPNPHLWMDPVLVMSYVDVIGETLARVDPPNARTYRSNAAEYRGVMRALDRAIAEAAATVPEEHRLLLTYHDSFAYFARRYGFEVVGAIQPADFSEPSAGEVARLIGQIREREVPAVFGSEVFPSRILDQIAREAGVEIVGTLSDDDLPGEPGDPRHSYVGMMVENVATIVRALGGDPAALEGMTLPADAAVE